MESLVQELEQLLVAGDVEAAARLVQERKAADPTRGALIEAVGLSALAVHKQDAAACLTHARAALALGPDEPLALHYMAVAHVMRGEHGAAEDFEARAVEQGGGRRCLGWLANIRLGQDKLKQAEAAYRAMLAIDPGDVQALNGLGAVSYKQQHLDQAVGFFAQAYDKNPLDPAPIHSLMNMYGEAGRVLGAIALCNLTRDHHPDDETQMAMSLMLLQLTRTLMGDLPPAGATTEADEVVADLLQRASRRPLRVKLGAARALIDCRRFAEADRLVSGLDPESLEVGERANLHYVRGLVASGKSNDGEALREYVLAVETDPARWDACCNAISLLLEKDDEQSLSRIEGLLERVPAAVKGATPQLLLNEAVYRKRMGRFAEARVGIERVLQMTGGQGELGDLANALLKEIKEADSGSKSR